MVVLLRTPRMTRDEFLDWAEARDGRHEFDGFEPVAMTGGLIAHNQICQNLWAGLRTRLTGSGCRPLGPDAGLATVGDAVRYPDALVTSTPIPKGARLVPGVVVVFEVLSPSSGWVDRIEKLREYASVPTIRRYVVVEHARVGLTSFARTSADQDWTATALMADDVLQMPEIGIEVAVAELHESVEMDDAG